MIYFIEAVGADAVKVGYSLAEPGKRLATMQTGSPHELRLLRVADGDVAQEKALHALWSDHRIRGEWFRLSTIANDVMAIEPLDVALAVRSCKTCGVMLRSKHVQRHFTGMCKPCAHKDRAHYKACARCGAEHGGLRRYGGKGESGLMLCAACVPVVREERAAVRRAKQSTAMQGNLNAVGRSARGKLLLAA